MEVKRTKDYIPKLKELYPEVPEAILRKIVRAGFGTMINALREDYEIKIGTTSKANAVNVLIFKNRFYRKDETGAKGN